MKPNNQKLETFTVLILLTATLAIVIPDLNEVGVTWDEPEAHFNASQIIIAWVKEVGRRIRSGNWVGVYERELLSNYWPPSTRESQAHLGFNDHPPLSRYLPTITWLLFHNKFSDVVSYRLSSAFLFASLVAGVFWVMTKEIGFSSGLFASVSLLLMPRVFGHSHIAATDMPITVFWFFSIVSFHTALKKNKYWKYVFSFLLAFAWLTKFTGFLIPVALMLYVFFCRDRRAWKIVNPTIWLCPLLLWVLNPTWWRNPIKVLSENFFKLFLNRQNFAPHPTYYLGKTYWFDLPWHHSFVLTLATVPLTILLCALIGFSKHIKQWNQKGLITLFFWQLIWFYFVMMLPFTPNHDGVRLFLPVFPFWACFAGLGFRWLLNQVRQLIVKNWPYQNPPYGITSILTILLLSYPAFNLAKIRPFYLESFNTLVGGIEGAHQLGFETTYWMDTISRKVRMEINQLPNFSRIVSIPSHLNYFKFLKSQGLIKNTLAFNTILGDYLILIPRQGRFDDYIWKVYREGNPLFVASIDKVPMVLIYKLEKNNG